MFKYLDIVNKTLQLKSTSLETLGNLPHKNVLIKVAYAGVNRPDALQRRGHYPPPPGASPIPGLEIAGEIVNGDLSGDNPFNFKIGDKVCALVQGGGYATHCVTPLATCLPIPKDWSLKDAAGLPETFFTVWSNFLRVGLKKGETVLIHGGTSGIGVTAIQIAKALDCKVAVTCGTQSKIDAALRVGADVGVNYKTQEWEKQVLSWEPKGVNVVLDMVGGDYINKDVTCCSEEGRIVIIAVQGGVKGEVDWMQLMRKRVSITGSTLRPRDTVYKAEIAKSLYETVWPLLDSVKIKPMTFKTFSLEQGQAAHDLMESGEHVGKIILDCQS